jgi:cytochrome c oxidase subunit 2
LSWLLALWPAQASAHAAAVDSLLICFTVLIAVLSAPVFFLIVAFAIKYRRGRRADRSHPVNRNVWLEISWSAIPFCLILIFFVWSSSLYFNLHRPPAGALEINVVAKQWMWKFQHSGGQGEIADLHVPVGEPVKLTMTSEDVIHSLFLPALRLKQDVLPGRYTEVWFIADKPGQYKIECTQFCGTDHAVMGGQLFLLSGQDYARWLEGSTVDGTLLAQGATLFRTLGCSGCHSAGASVRAPLLNGLAGRPVHLTTGEVVVADDQYIRDSILLPNAQIAAGYAPLMPTFQNVIGEDDLVKLIAYIKSLKADQP